MWCMPFSKCRLSVIFVAIAIKICPKLFSISTEDSTLTLGRKNGPRNTFPTGILNEPSFTIPDDELVTQHPCCSVDLMDEPAFILSNDECTAESCSNQGKRDWVMSCV